MSKEHDEDSGTDRFENASSSSFLYGEGLIMSTRDRLDDSTDVETLFPPSNAETAGMSVFRTQSDINPPGSVPRTAPSPSERPPLDPNSSPKNDVPATWSPLADATDRSRTHPSKAMDGICQPILEDIDLSGRKSREAPYSLADVQNAIPKEDNAEKAVMETIENQTAANMEKRLSSKVVFPEVPDDRIHDFDDFLQDTEKSREHDRNSTPQESSGTTERERKAKANPQDNLQKLAKALHAVTEATSPNRAEAESKEEEGRRKYPIDKLTKDAARIFATQKTASSVKDLEAATSQSGSSSAEEQSSNYHNTSVRKFTAFFQTKAKQAERRLTQTGKIAIEDIRYFNDFVQPRKAEIRRYWQRLLWYLILPSLAISILLFYGFDNPPTGKNDGSSNTPTEVVDITVLPNGTETITIRETNESSSRGSASWWLLFLGARQVTTFLLAKLSEMLVIDFFCLRTRFAGRMLGPHVSLFVTQSRGWPFKVAAWAVIDLCMLSGPTKFAAHWLFFQSFLEVFNAKNTSAEFIDSNRYFSILFCALGVGIATTIKRTVLGRQIGRRQVTNHGAGLSLVMKKMLLVSEVAHIPSLVKEKLTEKRFKPVKMTSLERIYSDDDEENPREILEDGKVDDRRTISDELKSIQKSIDQSERTPGVSSKRLDIMELLGEWEEPLLEADLENKEVSMASILHFRRALTFIETDWPFSQAFGPASTRTECVMSAQKTFARLAALQTETDGESLNNVLSFSVICRTAENQDGSLDRDKAKELISIFRPQRDGSLSKLEFVKSIDTIYKELKLLAATIINSSKNDQTYEGLVNTVFYTIVVIVVLGVLGFNTIALLSGLGALIVGLGFMIGSAASRYLEGILLILVQKPFDIGDRIHVSDINDDTDPTGSDGWIVEKVDLYSTTMRLALTREVATIANGSLSRSRIINMKRSEKPNVYVHLKFGVNVPYQKILAFKKACTDFVKERPREWLRLDQFRAVRIEADLGFIEYVMVLQHRDTWQQLVPILLAKAEVQSFCLELQKQMGMRYISPPMPVQLDMSAATGSKATKEVGTGEADLDSRIHDIAAMFENKKSK